MAGLFGLGDTRRQQTDPATWNQIAYGTGFDFAPVAAPEVQQAGSRVADALSQTWPARMAQEAWGAAQHPGNVYQGTADPYDTEKAMGMAGLMAGGGMPMAQKGAAGIFGGRLGANAEQSAALARAEQMAASGAERKAIWDQTGWFQGADGGWRFEIPDNAARIAEGARGPILSEGGTAGAAPSVLAHDALYEAYPQLRRTFIDATVQQGHTGPRGSFVPGEITATRDTLGGLTPTLLHEMQHAVQNIEGFSGGANTLGLKASMSEAERAAVIDAYRRAAGEVEARAVEARRPLSPAARQGVYPWSSEDIERARQIIR